MTSPEYTRGYSRGRKRTEKEVQESIDAANRNWDALRAKRTEASIAIMAGLLAGSRSCTMDGKAVSNTDQYAELAVRAADSLMQRLGIK